MAILPYPPAPEPGWYADDVKTNDAAHPLPQPMRKQQSDGTPPADGKRPANTAQPGAAAQPVAIAQPNHAAQQARTVQLSEAPHQFVLHNDTTGQNITISRNTLLGRKPALNSLQGFATARIDDPTRTTSRTHATLSIDDKGHLWIEDCDSLNGTYIIRGNHETQVPAGTPMRLDVPATVRLGDLFFELTQHTASEIR